MDSLRVATLNIWNRLGPWEERLAAIRAEVERLQPDILGLQEVLVLPEHDFDQAALVAEGFGYHVAWGRAPDATTYTLGNAVLSRWPIARTSVFGLPGTDEKRCAVLAQIDAPSGTVPFVSTHLNWRLDEGHVRQQQVRALTSYVAANTAADGYPPIVVGDFNAEPDSDEIRFMRGLTGLGGPCVYYADAFALAGDGSAGHTFARTNPYAALLREPDRRIDYVWVRGGDERFRGEVLEARVAFDSPLGEAYPSDHFGLVAVLRA